MKNFIIFSTIIFSFYSCDFSSGGREQSNNNPTKDTTLTPKVKELPKREVKKDSSTVKQDDEFAKLKDEKRLLEEEIKRLKELAENTSIELKHSEYYPVRAQQVQEILNFIYNKKVKILKNSGMQSLTGDRLRKICDIAYCDDAVLESLDKKCEWLNRVFASGIQINFDNFYTDKNLINKITYSDERKSKKK